MVTWPGGAGSSAAALPLSTTPQEGRAHRLAYTGLCALLRPRDLFFLYFFQPAVPLALVHTPLGSPTELIVRIKPISFLLSERLP